MNAQNSYWSGLQPLISFCHHFLGLRPRLLWSDLSIIIFNVRYRPLKWRDVVFAKSSYFAIVLKKAMNRTGFQGSAAATMINLLFAGFRMTINPSGAASLWKREFWFPISHSLVEVSPFRKPGPRNPVLFTAHIFFPQLFFITRTASFMQPGQWPRQIPQALGQRIRQPLVSACLC